MLDDNSFAERHESVRAIANGSKMQQLCDLVMAGTLRVNLEPPLLQNGRHPQGKPRAISVVFQVAT